MIPVFDTVEQEQTDQKIRSFSRLPNGWHFGSGVRPPDKNIDRARYWQVLLNRLGFHSADAFPGVDGEIAVMAQLGDRAVEVILELDDSITFYADHKDTTTVTLEHVPEQSAIAELSKIAGEVWSTFVLFIPETSIGNKTDLRVWRFETPQMQAARQLFNVSASGPAAQPYVNISGDITQALPAIRQSSGYLTNQSSPITIP